MYERATSLSADESGSIIGHRLVDSGTRLSMTATKQGARVEAIPLHLQPEIAGAGGGVIRATHRVWQRIPAALRALQPAGAVDVLPFLWGPAFRYDVVSTEQLADIGISAVFCAADRAAYLVAAGGDYRDARQRTRCYSAGGMWAVPGWSTSPTVALPVVRCPRESSSASAVAVHPTEAASPAPRSPPYQHPAVAVHPTEAASPAPRSPPYQHPHSRLRQCTPQVDTAPIALVDGVLPAPTRLARDHHPAAADESAAAPAPAPQLSAAEPVVGAAPTTQLTPVEYGQARMLLWNPTHDDTVSILRRCGLRPVHVDRHRAQLDQQRAIANQHARPMVSLPPTGLRPERETITSDTLGGKFPPSRAGNQWCITHTFSSRPHQVFATFSANHDAAASWAGLRTACQAAGIPVLADAISQPIEFVSDNGTEFRGVFAQQLDKAGISRSASTAHKKKKHGAQAAETANAALQAMMRKGLVMSRANFEAHGQDARDYWDYLASAGSNAIGTLRRAKDTTMPKLSWAQIVRANGGAPFGARGTITNQAGGHARAAGNNQLTDRAIVGLYLGATANKKCRMLTENGDIVVSSDVTFAADAMLPITGPVDYADTDAWLEPVMSSFAVPADDAGEAPPAAVPPPPPPPPPPPLNGGGAGHRLGAPTHSVPPADAPPPAGTSTGGPRGSLPATMEPRGSSPPGLAGATGSNRVAHGGVIPAVADLGMQASTPARATSVSQRDHRAASRRHRMTRRPLGAAAPEASTTPTVAATDEENGAMKNGVLSDAVDNGATFNVAPATPARPPGARAVSVSRRAQRIAERRSRQANQLRNAADGARHDNLVAALPRTVPSAPRDATQDASPVRSHLPSRDTVAGTGGPKHVGGNGAGDADASVGPSFSDDAGNVIFVGDTVRVAWLGPRGSRRHTYQGVVTAISREDDTYQVDYEDGSQHWHPITVQRAPVLKRTSLVCGKFDARTHRPTERHSVSLVARRPEPHPDVLFALDQGGNINPGYWDGTLTLGPEPAMPNVSERDAPPDPTTVYHALAHPHAEWWLHSIVRERRGHLAPINRPPTYHFTTRRPRGRPLLSKWVFTVKRRKGDGTIIKFKSRECIAGWHLRRGVDFVESYSGMTPWSDVLALESLAALLGLDIHEWDLTQAYAFARMPDTPSGDPVIVLSAPGVQVYDTDGVLQHQQADQAWYGHPAAGTALSKHIHGLVTGIDPPAGKEVCPIPFRQNPFQPCMYGAQYPVGHPRHGEIFILHVSTDNLRVYSSCAEMPREFLGWLRRNFQVTGDERPLQDQEPQQFMGCQFTYHPDRTVVIDMPQYVGNLLREVGMQDANPVVTPMAKGLVVTLQDAPTDAAGEQAVVDYANKAFGTHHRTYADSMSFYAHLVSSIGWIANRVGPTLLHAHSLLCRVLSAPTIAGFQAVKRVLRYLAGKRDMCRVYRPGRQYDWRNGDLPAFSIESDSSYADDPHDRRGQGGFVGGFDGQAATTAVSKKTRRVAVSVDQSESDFAGSACKEAEYHRNWMDFFGLLKAGPTKLNIDNFATALRAGSTVRRWSPSTKQHDVNEKYVVECVERKTVAVHHKPGSLPEDPRPGDGFRPDAMTKALPRAATEFYYDEIHGRRPLPPNTRSAVDGTALCTVVSAVHSPRSIFAGLVGVRYDDGTHYHVVPDRIRLYRGEEQPDTTASLERAE